MVFIDHRLRHIYMVMQVLHSSAGADKIDDSLDRQNLATLSKRFMHVNEDRMLRLDMALNHNQSLFLKALPLLFHCNHPMLPGFVSHSTPSGVSDYKPSKADLSYGKALARSFCMTGGYHGEDIWGIYLMGSVGTLAQSQSSDFDIWLCHKPGLSKSALEELQQKCQRMSQWAESVRLEVHFFLMDCDAFRDGQQLILDEESSGTAQRFLLLDEFYRTALYIAGRLPMWWFCASGREHDYQAHTKALLDRRFVRPNTTLDFGAISQIPDGEFIGAGIWQLYKAIGSPYKSVLKLLLMEAYVHDYPNMAPLSLDYKQMIYDASLNIDDLDPYVMVYRRIERYLIAEDDQNRLELVRRCLYFKVNKPLSKPPSQRGKSWQRKLLERLVDEWGWTEDYVHLLDQRHDWKTLQVKQERNQLVHALNHSYDMLMEFAQRSGSARSISNDELHVLGRKLQAAFERRPGKLEWVNPGISTDISESGLAFVEARTIASDISNEKPIWQLFGETTGSETPLRQTESPVELLLWCYANKIVDGHFRIDVQRAPHLSESQLRRCLNRLQTWLPNPSHGADHDTFKRQAEPTHALLLINVGAETPSPFGDHVHRLSDNSDPLKYGALGENLVASIDLVVRNSWEEITCQRFTGKNALLDVLQVYASLCMPGSYQAPPILDIECLGNSHAALITQRLRQWFHEISTCYYTGIKPPSTRYLFALGDRFYSLQFRGPKLVILDHKNEQQLLHYLGESQKRYSPLVIDSYTLRNHPLRLIAKKASARAINVYFQRIENHLDTWIVDEKGSLIRFTLDYTPKLNALNSLHVFMRTILERLHKKNLMQLPKDFGVHPIAFHEFKPDPLGQLRLSPRVITPEPEVQNIAELQCSVSCSDNGQFLYNFTLENQCFSWRQLGQDVFYATAEFILSMRRNHGRYPVFLTNLDLEDCAEQLSSTQTLQLSHYLRFKMDLERKLSSAIRSLR